MLYVFYTGKSAGFVTTARITHASPAPLYGWTPDRSWEDDSKLSDEAKQNGCPDMAAQLLHDKASKMQVMLNVKYDSNILCYLLSEKKHTHLNSLPGCQIGFLNI